MLLSTLCFLLWLDILLLCAMQRVLAQVRREVELWSALRHPFIIYFIEVCMVVAALDRLHTRPSSCITLLWKACVCMDGCHLMQASPHTQVKVVGTNLFIVMELGRGGDLMDWLLLNVTENKPLAPEIAARQIYQVLQALVYLEQQVRRRNMCHDKARTHTVAAATNTCMLETPPPRCMASIWRPIWQATCLAHGWHQ